MKATRFKPVPNILDPEQCGETRRSRRSPRLVGFLAFMLGLSGGIEVWRLLSAPQRSPAEPAEVGASAESWLKDAPAALEPRGDSLDYLRRANRFERPPEEDVQESEPRMAWRTKTFPRPSAAPRAERRGFDGARRSGGAAFQNAQSRRGGLKPLAAFKPVQSFMPVGGFTGSEFKGFKQRDAQGAAARAAGSGSAAGYGGGAVVDRERGGASSDDGRRGSLGDSVDRRGADAAVGAVKGMLGNAVAQGLLSPEQTAFGSAKEAMVSSMEYTAKLAKAAAAKAPPSAAEDGRLAVEYTSRAVELARAGDLRGATALQRAAAQSLRNVAAARSRSQGGYQ